MCRCSETFRSFKVSISIDRVLLRSYKVSNSLDQVLLRSYKVYIGRYEHLIWHRTSGDVPSCAGTVKHLGATRFQLVLIKYYLGAIRYQLVLIKYYLGAIRYT